MEKHTGVYWKQAVAAILTGGATAWAAFSAIGASPTVALGSGVLIFVILHWVFAWVGRIQHWYRRGTQGVYSRSCPECGQYVYRMGGDWILECKQCGWQPGVPGLRWLTTSVPAIQLRRTVSTPSVVLLIIAVGLIAAGSTGILAGTQNGPSSPPSGAAVTTTTLTPYPPDEGTPTSTATPVPENPWRQETITVAVRNQAAPHRNFTAAVASAIKYLQSRDDDYGAYTVEFRLEPNASNPDIVVWYNQTINCEDSFAAGCAPLLNASYPADPPENVQIEHNKTRNFRQTREIIVHEFGHILGIQHCEQPHWVMGHSHYCTGGEVLGPDVEDQEFAWRDQTLTYYISYQNVSAVKQTRAQVQHAVSFFEEGAQGTVPANVTLTRVSSEWRADIVIRFVDSCPDTDGGVCPSTWGSDYDSDGAFEYHTKTVVRVSEPDVDARGWFVGWALANSLTPDHLPSVFVDPTYEEIRSEWWESE